MAIRSCPSVPRWLPRLRGRWLCHRVSLWLAVIVAMFYIADCFCGYSVAIGRLGAADQLHFLFDEGGLIVNWWQSETVELRTLVREGFWFHEFQSPHLVPYFKRIVSGWRQIFIPTWIFIILLTATMFWTRPIKDLLKCSGCGYDLRGSTSTRCPECGKAIQRKNS